MAIRPPRAQHFLERFFGDAPLLCSKLLNADSENASPLRQVIDVASGFDQFGNIPVLQSETLLAIELECIAIRIFIETVGFAILTGVEGVAHFV